MLKAEAKEYGVEILTRLQLADGKAHEIVRILTQEGVGSIAGHSYLIDDFEGIWLAQDNGPPIAVPGFPDSSVGPLLEPTVAREDTGPELIITSTNELLLLKSAPQPSPSGTVIVFQLKAPNIWGARENLPYSAEFCVFSEAGAMLSCTADVDPGIHAALIANADIRSSTFSHWTRGEQKQVAALWQLFLGGTFAASPVDVVAIQELEFALAPGSGFWRVFLPAIALVLVLAGVLSLNLIARSLVPLQHLTLAARQLASGDLTSRARVRTGDEFEWLAEAFNNMASKLGRQIATLKAMSGIDRLILSGTKFEDVSEDVVKHLVGLTNCDAAAVIARDVDAPNKAKMISFHDGKYYDDRIDLPGDLHHDWCQPQQVELSEVKPAAAPYKTRFVEFGQNFVVLIPVILNDDIKGILLLGFESQFDMSQGSLSRCIDLAGRFAVALSSVEREETLYRQAHFDSLTDLPNRQLLKDRLEQHLASARIDQYTGAVLFLDLDRFKEINDMFGHSVGDLLLVQASLRIVSEVRTRDTVARLGGDEFVIVLPNVRNNSIVQATAERLLTSLSEAFSVDGADHYVSASIGIVVFPDDGDSVEMLLKNADAAMYRAKEAGRNRFEFFSERLNAESRRKIGLERDLREALRERNLEVLYQPQFDISTGNISGAEALLRWNHTAAGPISPDEFIPLAEESGLIIEIGSWVIEQACRDLRELLNEGLHPGPMSINVSARQLREQSFMDTVMDPIRRCGIHPGYIQLEVTETAVAQNRDTAIQILRSLRQQGVHVAIDDFGTGYSSLSYLQQMPFDVIKIDKSFVQAIGSNVASDNICRTIIKMAAELGKKSIAEGVEDRDQLEFLQKNGCDFIQGFFYSKPLSKNVFVSFLTEQGFHTQRRKALEVL
jgi:diguanylate cyclase (GGDEF)-like protein